MKVGITYHEKFSQYDLGLGHPFRGDRFIKTLDLFKEKGLLNLPEVVLLSPEPSNKRNLIRVHHEDYINLIFLFNFYFNFFAWFNFSNIFISFFLLQCHK